MFLHFSESACRKRIRQSKIGRSFFRFRIFFMVPRLNFSIIIQRTNFQSRARAQECHSFWHLEAEHLISDTIHVDEKIFYIKKIRQRCLLVSRDASILVTANAISQSLCAFNGCVKTTQILQGLKKLCMRHHTAQFRFTCL